MASSTDVHAHTLPANPAEEAIEEAICVGEAASLSKSSLMLAFRLALQTFDAIGVRYLDQLVKKRIRPSNMTPNNITQKHTLLRRCSQPYETTLGPVGTTRSWGRLGRGFRRGKDTAIPRLQPSHIGCPLRRVSQTECHGPSTFGGTARP